MGKLIFKIFYGLVLFISCVTIQCCKKEPSENKPVYNPCEGRVPVIYGYCLPEYPANQAFITETSVVLRWTAAMQSPLYEIYFGTHTDSLKSVAKQSENSLTVKDLSTSTTYFWKIFASDICGRQGNSGIYRFTIIEDLKLPYVETIKVPEEQTLPVNLGGIVLYKGKSNLLERGICLGKMPDPEITGKRIILGCDSGFYFCTLDTLKLNSVYYYKSYATSDFGTFYGKEFKMNIIPKKITDSVSDIEGNKYSIVSIGSQVWLKENLRSTKLNDGTIIPYVTENNRWNDLSMKYTWLGNDSSFSETYGAIYNGFVATSGKICPVGWHVPADAEWKTLEQFLGLPANDSSKIDMRGTYEGLKLKSDTGWINNGNGIDMYGFSGLPGGYRHPFGSFTNPGETGQWWSSSKHQKFDYLWSRSLRYDASGISRTNTGMQYGCSIRCIKD